MPLYHVQRIVVVRHADGLHARPAEMVARQAMQYRSRIELVRDHLRIDARSILNILTLGAECGVQLVVEAEGDDAEEAAAGVARLIEGEFNTETPSELAGPCGEGD